MGTRELGQQGRPDVDAYVVVGQAATEIMDPVVLAQADGIPVVIEFPVRPIPTEEELDKWFNDKAEGATWEKDPRDMPHVGQTATMHSVEAPAAEEADAIPIHAMPAHSSAEELAAAEEVLQAHNRGESFFIS